jgi:hypothetical protein
MQIRGKLFLQANFRGKLIFRGKLFRGKLFRGKLLTLEANYLEANYLEANYLEANCGGKLSFRGKFFGERSLSISSLGVFIWMSWTLVLRMRQHSRFRII